MFPWLPVDALSFGRDSDEAFQSLVPCWSLASAQNPPRHLPPVAGRLRLMEFPGGLVLFDQRLQSRSQILRLLSVGIKRGRICLPQGKGLQARRPHPAGFEKPLDVANIYRAPDTAFATRSETNGVTVFVDTFANAIDPAVGERFVNR